MLEWQKKEKQPEETMSWYKAKKFAKTLRNGWRLATKEEFKQAYKDKVDGFTDGVYWSSETHVDNTNYAWVVDFSKVRSYGSDKMYNNYVRCVREIPVDYREELKKSSIGLVEDVGSYGIVNIGKDFPHLSYVDHKQITGVDLDSITIGSFQFNKKADLEKFIDQLNIAKNLFRR